MKLLASLSLFFFLLLPTLAFAQEDEAVAPAPEPPVLSAQYTPLSPISSFVTGTYDMKGEGLSLYLTGIFKLAIGLAGVLAVVMLVICGIRLMATGSTSGKSEAKQCIMKRPLGPPSCDRRLGPPLYH